jgi:hypothetical protein
MPSRASLYGTIIAITLVTLVITLGLVSLFNTQQQSSLGRRALALTDNLTQPVLASGQWTPVSFHRQVHASPDWRFSSATGPVHCLRAGLYWAYISVHAQPDTSDWNATDPVELRALRQRGTLLRECEGSLTSGSFGALSKIFLLDTQGGDNLYFQFRSLCPDARLVLGVPQGATTGVTSFPTSATMTLIPVFIE